MHGLGLCITLNSYVAHVLLATLRRIRLEFGNYEFIFKKDITGLRESKIFLKKQLILVRR